MTVILQISPVLHAQMFANAEAANLSVEEFLLVAAAEKIAAMDHHRWLTRDQASNSVDPCGKA